MPAKQPNETANAQVGSVATATIVQDFLEQLKPGKPIRQGSLSIIPLFPVNEQVAQHTGFMPLAAALTQGLLTITEQGQATVPELQATCVAETPVILLTGEQVIGGLQNRVLNATILLAAKTVSTVPVSCVEHGRWHSEASWDAAPPAPQMNNSSSNMGPVLRRQAMQRHQMASTSRSAPTFATEDTAYAGLRKKQMQSVSYNLASGAGYRSDQGEVWSEVAARMSKTNSYSTTAAMRELYNAPERAEKLSRITEAFTRPEGALGFIVAMGGKIVGAEVFSDEALMLAYWDKLTRSYALEALDSDQQEKASQEDTSSSDERDELAGAQLLAAARSAELQSYQSPGLGQDVRMNSTSVLGAGLVYDNIVVHLSLFAEEQKAEPVAQ